jgi:hypothetical protein
MLFDQSTLFVTKSPVIFRGGPQTSPLLLYNILGSIGYAYYIWAREKLAPAALTGYPTLWQPVTSGDGVEPGPFDLILATRTVYRV